MGVTGDLPIIMILRFIIFLSIFLSVYGAMHWYVFARLASLFSFNRGIIFYFIFTVSTLSYLGSHLLDSNFNNVITRIIYIIAATWMGVVFLLFSTLLVYEIVRLLIKIPQRTAGIGICILVVMVTLYSIVNALFIRVKTINIETHKVSRNYTIVHLSDLHIGSPHRSDFFKCVVEKTNAMHPDIVCITGDLFDRSRQLSKEAYESLKNFNAPVFLVSGNHETYTGYNRVNELIKDTGITFLQNQAVIQDDFQIIGIDYSRDKENLKKILSSIDIEPNEYLILLHHSPSGMKAAADAGIDLVLAGHLHAGQIFPFNLIVRIFYKYVHGLYHVDATALYVSPGTGTWGPPMRLGSRNEITVIKVTRTPSHQVTSHK